MTFCRPVQAAAHGRWQLPAWTPELRGRASFLDAASAGGWKRSNLWLRRPGKRKSEHWKALTPFEELQPPHDSRADRGADDEAQQ